MCPLTPCGCPRSLDAKVSFGERGGGSGGGGEEEEGIAIHGGGLELSYKRSARRRGGLEAAVGAMSLVDLSPRAAFPRLVSPGKRVPTLRTSVCKSKLLSRNVYSANRHERDLGGWR